MPAIDSETELSRQVVDTLRRFGVWVQRYQAGMVKVGGRWLRLGQEGTPDLVCIDPYIWLEVKLPDGKLSLVQQEWHARAARCGVPVAVVRSVQEAVRVVVGERKGRETT